MKKAAIITIGKLASPELANDLISVFNTEKTREGIEYINTQVSSRLQNTFADNKLSRKLSDTCWVYLGSYQTNAWATRYFDFGKNEAPETLINKVVSVKKETEQINLRQTPLGNIIRSLKSGKQVKVLDIYNYADLGYIWGRVELK